MGYRLDINYLDLYNENEVKNLYYGTKLYGYNLELDKSLSYKFLKTIHKFSGEEYFDYGDYNEIILNYEELCLFLELYNIDYNNFYEYKKEDNEFLEQKEIKDLFTNVGKYEDLNFIVGWC